MSFKVSFEICRLWHLCHFRSLINHRGGESTARKFTSFTRLQINFQTAYAGFSLYFEHPNGLRAYHTYAWWLMLYYMAHIGSLSLFFTWVVIEIGRTAATFVSFSTSDVLRCGFFHSHMFKRQRRFLIFHFINPPPTRIWNLCGKNHWTISKENPKIISQYASYDGLSHINEEEVKQTDYIISITFIVWKCVPSNTWPI